jgi:hypothetical protein
MKTPPNKQEVLESIARMIDVATDPVLAKALGKVIIKRMAKALVVGLVLGIALGWLLFA